MTTERLSRARVLPADLSVGTENELELFQNRDSVKNTTIYSCPLLGQLTSSALGRVWPMLARFCFSHIALSWAGKAEGFRHTSGASQLVAGVMTYLSSLPSQGSWAVPERQRKPVGSGLTIGETIVLVTL